MLNKVKTLKGYKLHCLDGKIGKIKEFYFDDQHWTVRYLIADTGNWLTGRQVLISPLALSSVNREEQYISINLTKKQIEDSPPLDSDKPVSRQFEDVYYGYYNWPTYYSSLDMQGDYPFAQIDQYRWKKFGQDEKTWDPSLRSTNEVTGYGIHASDGEIGHIEDFIIDDETWEIQYLIIATKNWWPRKKVLVSPTWIDQVNWIETVVFVNLQREEIKQSPEYTDESQLTREYENELHQHYNRQGYWVDKPADKKN